MKNPLARLIGRTPAQPQQQQPQQQPQQHEKISGYRTLTEDEIALMNEGKALEAEVLDFQQKVMRQLSHQESHGTPDDQRRLREAYAHRWALIGRDDIEKGFMALIRAVAQPQPQHPRETGDEGAEE